MKKRKTLPKEMKELLENGDISALKEQFLRCAPNAATGKYGSNIFSLTPLPRDFAFWAKEQGADVNFKDYYGNTPIFDHASFWNGDVQLLIDLGAEVNVAQDDGTTPLHQNRLPYPLLLEICQLLLDHGAEITDRCREFLGKSAKQFQRAKRGFTDLEFLHGQIEGLERLCQIFDVEPAGEVAFHDGVSPILVPVESKIEAFQWLWNYLVPPSGKAQTAQGEAIRIAGRVDHEITSNGGMNWNSDYRKMLRVFPQYLRLGNPLRDEDIAQAERIAHLLKDSRDDRTLSMQLCAYAVSWVLLNPKVLPSLGTDYSR